MHFTCNNNVALRYVASLFEQLGKQMLPLAKFPLASCHLPLYPAAVLAKKSMMKYFRIALCDNL